MPSPTNQETPDEEPKPEPEPTEAEYKAAIDHQWKTYQAINEWIRFADTKAGALLTVNGVLIGAAVGKMNAEQRFHYGHPVYWLALALSLACGGFLIASALHSLWCIEPILKTKATPPDKRSTIYFDHIAQNEDLDKYQKAVLKLTGDADAFQQIATQVYEVSKVATQKHEDIIESVKFLKIGLSLGIALLLVLSGLTLFSGAQP